MATDEAATILTLFFPIHSRKVMGPTDQPAVGRAQMPHLHVPPVPLSFPTFIHFASVSPTPPLICMHSHNTYSRRRARNCRHPTPLILATNIHSAASVSSPDSHVNAEPFPLFSVLFVLFYAKISLLEGKKPSLMPWPKYISAPLLITQLNPTPQNCSPHNNSFNIAFSVHHSLSFSFILHIFAIYFMLFGYLWPPLPLLSTLSNDLVVNVLPFPFSILPFKVINSSPFFLHFL